jgi:hypothetical protein
MTDHIEAIKNMINYAVQEKPLDFQSSFDSLIHDRIGDSINNRKIEVAQSMFRSEETPNETEELPDQNIENSEESEENGEES